MTNLEEALRSLKPWQLRKLVLQVRDQIAGLMVTGDPEGIADAVVLVQVQLLLDETPADPDAPTCTAEEGCDRPIYARGLCSMHYVRFRRNGTTTRRRTYTRNLEVCIIPGCDRPVRARSRCWPHYRQLLRSEERQGKR